MDSSSSSSSLYEINERFRELCYVGDLELVKQYFQQSRPDVNSQNKINGWTALHWAARTNNIPIVRFLIEHGADINIVNQKGQKAGHQAKDAELKLLLGSNDDHDDSNNEFKSSFTPNFIKNPDFHYAQSYLYNTAPSSLLSSSHDQTTIENNNYSTGSVVSSSKHHQSGVQITPTAAVEFITIRVKAQHDEDFVEFDLDKNNTDFEAFKKMCIDELDETIDHHHRPIVKIRKLPNTLVRNSADIKRLKNEQEIEIIFAQ